MLKYEELSRDRRTEKLIVDMRRKSLQNANMRTGVIAYELKVANDYEESIRDSNDQNQQQLAHERVDYVQKALDDAIKEQGRRRQQLKQGKARFAKFEKVYTQVKGRYEAAVYSARDSDDGLEARIS